MQVIKANIGKQLTLLIKYFLEMSIDINSFYKIMAIIQNKNV